MQITPVLIGWLALVVGTIALAIYRGLLAKEEDTNIHLIHGGGAVVEGQAAMAGKLAAIDKWGKILTIITFVAGVLIGASYVYEALLAVPV
jgi:uncharacterized membrane protein